MVIRKIDVKLFYFIFLLFLKIKSAYFSEIDIHIYIRPKYYYTKELYPRVY